MFWVSSKDPILNACLDVWRLCDAQGSDTMLFAGELDE